MKRLNGDGQVVMIALKRSFSDAVGQVMQRNLPLLGFGFIITSVFVAFNMGKMNLLQNRVRINKFVQHGRNLFYIYCMDREKLDRAPGS